MTGKGAGLRARLGGGSVSGARSLVWGWPWTPPCTPGLRGREQKLWAFRTATHLATRSKSTPVPHTLLRRTKWIILFLFFFSFVNVHSFINVNFMPAKFQPRFWILGGSYWIKIRSLFSRSTLLAGESGTSSTLLNVINPPRARYAQLVRP